MEASARPSYSQLEKPEVEAARPVSRRWALGAAGGLAGAAALAFVAFTGRGGMGAAAGAGTLRREEVVELEEEGSCSSKFRKPEKPDFATALNGVRLDDVCIKGDGPHHVFIIGDWGGLVKDGQLTAVSHLNHRWNQSYQFIWPTDQECQFRVRDQMVARAPASKPAYVLNVGDNFYWGGVYDYCGEADFSVLYGNGGTEEHKKEPTNQFKQIFEDIYNGPGLDGLTWLGVLGNHDWGGWRFDMAWDQAIGYTWNKDDFNKGRWLTPALYYSVTVHYPTFTVDYYFMDTNVWDALPYGERPPHNICGPHTPSAATCKAAGGPPARADACKEWFEDLWEEQKGWVRKLAAKSKAHWRIAVTHFPPYWGKHDWASLAPECELDAVITGHRHSQNMHGPVDKPGRIWPEDSTNFEMNDFLDPTAWAVCGGGGGITSEHVPDTAGNDDQYGFIDMTLSKEKLTFAMISHGGQVRRTLEQGHYYSHNGLNEVIEQKKHEKDSKGHKKKADDDHTHKSHGDSKAD